jgi:hypothetical protein
MRRLLAERLRTGYTACGHGSVVTYYWYRFADQPALLNADLSVPWNRSVKALAARDGFAAKMKTVVESKP